jgi:hypothetical protein
MGLLFMELPMLKWTRSKDGSCESHDGRFKIEPVFMGKTTPQAYHLYDGGIRPRVQVAAYLNTQAEAKERAEVYLHYLAKA